MMRSVLLLFVTAACAYSQSFEVVSIKPSPPPDGTGMSVSSGGGPGSQDPSRWRCHNMSLAGIVSNAFDLKVNELTAPGWMGQARFDIEAKVPDGATKADLLLMMQHMLAERFGLKHHREKKEVQGYELVVGKGGPKFKESAPEPPKDTASPDAPKPPVARTTIGEDGFPVLPPGFNGMVMSQGRARSQWLRTTMDDVARNLGYQVDKPVMNGTGLTGKYDVVLSWRTAEPRLTFTAGEAPPPEPAGPSLFTAVQEQLGLKLEAKKMIVGILVVDDARKVPTEN